MDEGEADVGGGPVFLYKRMLATHALSRATRQRGRSLGEGDGGFNWPIAKKTGSRMLPSKLDLALRKRST